jgi:hypothetical protein
MRFRSEPHRPARKGYTHSWSLVLAKVPRRFFNDLRAFHAEKDAIKADAIAARQLHALLSIRGRARKSFALPT